MRRLLAALGLAVVVLVAGCFNPKYAENLQCSTRNTCPPGFGCNPMGRCQRNFTPDARGDAISEAGTEAKPEAPGSDAASGDADASADVSSPDVTADASDASDGSEVGQTDAADGGAGDAPADKAEAGADAVMEAPVEAKPEAPVEAGMDVPPEVGPPPGGLIGRWALGDEHTNNEVVPDLATADGAQNGVIFDNGEFMQTVKDRNGKANQAIQITADDFVSDQWAYIRVLGITSLPASVSISAWIAFTNGNQLGLIAGLNHGPQLYMDEYHVTMRMPTDTFNYGAAQGPVLTDNAWRHVVGVVAPAGAAMWKIDLYVNGALYMSATTPNNGINPTGNFNIGGMYNCSGQGCNDGFKGYLDDVRIYDKALNAAEVLALYNASTL
jgi:hypothetical protein